MKIICLDLEGVLVPEIWIEFSRVSGIPELSRTTRDEPDYDKLMRFRIKLLAEHSLKLQDVQNVIATMEPLAGAAEFTAAIRERTQLIILSDTFAEFASPLMKKLNYPTLFCNNILTDNSDAITGYKLRQANGKKAAVEAFKSINMEVFAAGDSYNDLAMIAAADAGCLFRAPDSIRLSHPELTTVDTHTGLQREIEKFLLS
jgi:phosphoserine/homoserine phosphotransferase